MPAQSSCVRSRVPYELSRVSPSHSFSWKRESKKQEEGPDQSGSFFRGSLQFFRFFYLDLLSMVKKKKKKKDKEGRNEGQSLTTTETLGLWIKEGFFWHAISKGIQ